MSDSLAALEQQRSGILSQILELGDFRSGSITAIKGRCGKPNCHCHQPNQPGHGPNFRLTRKINGKTVSESFTSAAELRKAQREVDAFHRFRELSQRLLEVNERICRARRVQDTLSPEEKKGRSDPPGNRARSRATARCDLYRPLQDRASRFGSDRNGRTRGHASGRSRGPDRVAAISSAGPADYTVPVWAASTLSGTALENSSDRGWGGGSLTALVSVSALSSRAVSRGPGTRHQGY